MPLERLDDDHRTSTHGGIEFWMSEENGGLVFCRVSHEAQDHPNRNHLAATDNEIFEAFRQLIEQVASDAFDAEIGVDEAGYVTKEALDRVGRSA